MDSTKIDILWTKSQQNDRKAQAAIYQVFSSKMFGVCLRYADSNFEAEDILQTGFVKVFTKAHLYDGKGSLEGWIRRIMVNTAIEFYRQRKKAFASLSDNEEDVLLLKSDLAADNTGYKDLVQLINALPIGYRTIFNMYVVEGYSHRDIASMLNISESNSKSQLSRARAWLKERLIKMEIVG